MKTVIFGGVIFGVIVLAGFWELRRAGRAAGRAALDQAMRTVPAQAPSPSNEECEDALMTGVIEHAWLGDDAIAMTREDQPLSLTWCDPGDVDRIDYFRRVWAAEQEGR